MRQLSNWALGLSLIITLLSACKEPCEEITCENGGACIEGTCECPEGFSGEFCETFEADQLIGTYTADYGGCFSVSPNHEVIITQQAGQSNAFDLFNLGDYDCPDGTLRLSFTVNVNQVSLPSQTVDCGPISYTFEGEGAVENGVLTLNFTNTYDAGGFEQVDDCVASLTLKN